MAKGVPITLDKERRIRFTLATWRKMSRDMDPRVMEGLYTAFQGDGEPDFRGTLDLMAAMCDLLWLGLLHEDDTLTVDQVGAMVDADNYNQVFEALGKAFQQAFPEGVASENPTTRGPSTGPRSPVSASAGSASYPTSSGG